MPSRWAQTARTKANFRFQGAAHKQNPFVAEFLAFAPAFESVFPFACELPPEGKGVEAARRIFFVFCFFSKSAGVAGGGGGGQSRVLK